MKITSSEYLKSYLSVHNLDLPPLPAVAFIGRSNVGKSSLINNLLNRRNLVKTSSTPGKTRLINYFFINKSLYFVDLPGYGFANVPKSVRGNWGKMLKDFLRFCPELRLVVQLVDIRHKPSAEDVRHQMLLQSSGLPCVVIANKADKIKKSRLKQTVEGIEKSMNLYSPPLVHSALKKIGGPKILSVISDYLE